MGQSDNGKAIIEQEFPKETTPKGNTRIKPNKADMLRKYLRGKEEGKSGNDISNIAPDLEAYFDKKRYVEDLEQYENLKLKEFAKALQLEVNFNNPKAVKQAIADCYYSIIKNACKTRDNNNEESDKHKVLDRKIKRRHADKIDDIIDKIIELIKSMVYYYDSDREKESFQQNYSNYCELNSNLCDYALIYPFIGSIQKLPEYILKEKDFFVFEDSNPYLGNYKKYKELLLEIRKEITELDEE